MFDLDDLLNEYKVSKKSIEVLQKKREDLLCQLERVEKVIECDERILTGIEIIVEGMGHNLIHTENGWEIG